MGPATGVSTLWGQDAPGTCRGNQSLILAVPALGVCPSDAPLGTGGRDKATCTQVSPQTSTMTSSLACLKGMGVGMGASLSQNTFGALGILCLRQAPSVPGADLGLVTQTVPSMLRTSPLSPKPVYGGGDREGLGPEESVGVPGALVSAWGRRGGPPPHSFLLTFPLVGTPARRPPAARYRLGCSTLVLGPLPSGDQPPQLPRRCCLCLVPVSQAHGDLHRSGAGGAPPSFACWLLQGAGMQTPGEVKGSHGAPSPAQCGLAWYAHTERGLQPGAGGPGSVHVTQAVVPPWPLRAPRQRRCVYADVYFDVVCVGAFAFLWALFV